MGNLMYLMEQAACMRDVNRTNSVVSALVKQIVSAWRTSFAQNVAMKFNCFFLLPFLDEFPFFLRTELDALSEKSSQFMDLRDVREGLLHRIQSFETEREANSKLQGKFHAINEQLGHMRNGRSWGDKDRTDDLPNERYDLDDVNDDYPEL